MAERKIVTFHILFSLAVISVVLGTGLLVITTEKASGAYVYRPLILVTVGALFTYFAVITRLRAKFVFLGFVVTSAAIIRFTGTVLGIEFKQRLASLCDGRWAQLLARLLRA
ncbi:hypothetical protein MASR2M48_34380 [Spirochaetota bacterium]